MNFNQKVQTKVQNKKSLIKFNRFHNKLFQQPIIVRFYEHHRLLAHYSSAACQRCWHWSSAHDLHRRIQLAFFLTSCVYDLIKSKTESAASSTVTVHYDSIKTRHVKKDV